MRTSRARRSPSPGEASDVFSECGWIDMKWLQFDSQLMLSYLVLLA
jgi:hypothetical protein